MTRGAPVAWYVKRLRSMGPGEIAHRLAEQTKRLSYRRYDRGFADFRVGDGALPIIPGLARDVVRSVPDATDAALRSAAMAAREMPFSYLGQKWPENIRGPDGRLRPEAWFVDPHSGGLWDGSDRYCFDVNYRARPGWGDVKFVWEVSRLQFLQPIAVNARREGTIADGAAFVMDTLRGWMSANPPFRGVNWSSGIEQGLRIATVAIVVGALGDEAFSPSDRADLRAFLNAHAFWIHRYPSSHSSANNHLILEALGLFLVGLLVPDLPRSGEWESYGRTVLEREVTRQILEDGVGAEQSPTYTSFTLEAYLLAMLAASRVNRPLSATITDRVRLAGRHLRWIMDDGGNVPEIGDNDAGRVVAMNDEPEIRYVASISAAVAATIGDPQVTPPDHPPHLRDLIFGEPPMPAPAPTGLKVFGTGGYSVWRGPLNERDGLLIFDHGPLGYLAIAAHGHADALSIWLHLDDRPVIVDSGTYLYHSGAEWRAHFRSTAAHNTMAVSGRNSSTPAGNFNWTQRAEARLIELAGSDQIRMTAEHDGYVGRLGCCHRRTVTAGPTGLITLADSIDGTAEFDVEIAFHLHPDLVVTEASGSHAIFDRGVPLGRVVGPKSFEPLIASSTPTPGPGWYSPHFGLKVPSTRLAFIGRLGGDALATTMIEIFSRKIEDEG